MDMAGSAAVLGAIKAISSMNMCVNVVGVIAVAENAIGMCWLLLLLLLFYLFILLFCLLFNLLFVLIIICYCYCFY